jgi:hypothetical protein
MDPVAGKHRRLDVFERRLECCAGGADQIGQGGDAEVDTFQGEPLGLAVQRLVLTKFVIGDHRKQAGSGEGARDGVEWCWFLADFIAIAAGEFLAHMLDHLECAWGGFQRLGDTLAELGQARPTAAAALGRPGQDNALARQVLGERLARGTLAGKAGDGGGFRLCGFLLGAQFILGRGGLEVFELQFHLVDQPRRAFRLGAVERALELLDLQLQMRDIGVGVGLSSTLAQNDRFQCGNVVRQSWRIDIHDVERITKR